MRLKKALFYGLVTTTLLAKAAQKFECRQLVTPRFFGGAYKPSEFSTVAMDADGNMLAGGWTQDEAVFIPTIRLMVDEVQTTAPILAYYPNGAASHSEAKIFQIYIWAGYFSDLPVASAGQVKAVSITTDLQSSEEQTKPKYAALLEQTKSSGSTTKFLYALLLKKDSFEVMANYEITALSPEWGSWSFTGNSRSIYYRAEDDVLFLVMQSDPQDQDNQFRILMVMQPMTVGNTNPQACKSLQYLNYLNHYGFVVFTLAEFGDGLYADRLPWMYLTNVLLPDETTFESSTVGHSGLHIGLGNELVLPGVVSGKLLGTETRARYLCFMRIWPLETLPSSGNLQSYYASDASVPSKDYLYRQFGESEMYSTARYTECYTLVSDGVAVCLIGDTYDDYVRLDKYSSSSSVSGELEFKAAYKSDYIGVQSQKQAMKVISSSRVIVCIVSDQIILIDFDMETLASTSIQVLQAIPFQEVTMVAFYPLSWGSSGLAEAPVIVGSLKSDYFWYSADDQQKNVWENTTGSKAAIFGLHSFCPIYHIEQMDDDLTIGLWEVAAPESGLQTTIADQVEPLEELIPITPDEPEPLWVLTPIEPTPTELEEIEWLYPELIEEEDLEWLYPEPTEEEDLEWLYPEPIEEEEIEWYTVIAEQVALPDPWYPQEVLADPFSIDWESMPSPAELMPGPAELMPYETREDLLSNGIFEVIGVDQTKDFGAVRLIDLAQLFGSQTDMDSRSFQDNTEDDEGFIATIDPECEDPKNFPYCANGVFIQLGNSPAIERSECTVEGEDFWSIYEFWQRYKLCEHPGYDPVDLEQEVLRFSHGMDSHQYEPWFECEVEQRFDDRLKGQVHGFNAVYNVFRGAPETFVFVKPIELAGKFTSECYFDPLISEVVYSPVLSSTLESNPEQVKPIVSEPFWLSLSHERVSVDWATQGGRIGIETNEALQILETEPDILWLGVNLKNGQFYQSTITVEFQSDCNNLDFFTHEPNQIVYVPLDQPLPFRYSPVLVTGVTPAIQRVCQDLPLDEGSLEIVADDELTKQLYVTNKIGIDDKNTAIVISSLDGFMRQRSVYFTHRVTFSIFTEIIVESTITIRFICQSGQFETPLAAYPVNIFSVVSYEGLKTGQYQDFYPLLASPTLEPNCGYAVQSYLRLQETERTPAPFFLKFDSKSRTITVQMMAGMADLYAYEDIFSRYNVEIVYLAVNQDLLSWTQQETSFEKGDISSEETSLETAMTLLGQTVADSSENSFALGISIELPFVVQLQELGNENQAPSFDFTNSTLPRSIEMAVGTYRTLILPPIIDPEGDKVDVSVKFDGQEISSCTSNCRVKFNVKAGEVLIEYPLFYFLNQGKVIPKVAVLQFDNDGNVKEVVTALSDAIDVPLEDKVLTEPHLIELVLDDGTQIEVFRIDLTVIEDDQSSVRLFGIESDTFASIGNVGEQNDELPKETAATVSDEKKEEPSYVVATDDDDFDFLEWLDERQGVQKKMREFEGFGVAPEEIPWPEVTEVREDGKIQLVYAKNVLYRLCSVCKETEADTKGTGRGRQLATDYFNTQSYRDYLKRNVNIVIKLIPSSSSASINQQLDFTWKVSNLSIKSIEILVEFTNPEMVSLYDEKDMLQIQFFKTHQFMMDTDGMTKKILPSGFTLLTPLPRQQQTLTATEEKQHQTVVQSSQSLLTAMPVIGFVFNLSMQHLWGSVTAIQLTAHLPIINFQIPPNVMKTFETLVVVVTFDVFGLLIDDVDFGQSETEPYNDNINFLKYDSLNILSNLFSIHIFVVVLLLQGLLSQILQLNCCCNWAIFRPFKSITFSGTVFAGIIRILSAGYLEILLCSMLSLGILKLEQMTVVDKVTMVVNAIYLLALALFILFLTYFMLRKAKPLIDMKQTRDQLEHLKILQIIQEKVVFGPKCRTLAYHKQLTIVYKKQQTLNTQQLLQRTKTTKEKIATRVHQQMKKSQNEKNDIFENHEDLAQEISHLEKQRSKDDTLYKTMIDSYRKYSIFYDDRRLTWAALSENIFFIVRRTIFIASALYLTSGFKVMAAIAIFMIFCFAKLVFIITVKPFMQHRLNRAEIRGEFMILFVSYMAFVLLDQSMPREQILNCGTVIKWIIQAAVLILITNVLLEFFIELKQKVIRKFYVKVLKSKFLANVIKKFKAETAKKTLNNIKNRFDNEFELYLHKCKRDETVDAANSESSSRSLGESIELPSHREVDRAENDGIVAISVKQARYKELVYAAMCGDLDSSGMIDIDGNSFYESEVDNASMLSGGLAEVQEESSSEEEEEKVMSLPVAIGFDITEKPYLGEKNSSFDEEMEQAQEGMILHGLNRLSSNFYTQRLGGDDGSNSRQQQEMALTVQSTNIPLHYRSREMRVPPHRLQSSQSDRRMILAPEDTTSIAADRYREENVVRMSQLSGFSIPVTEKTVGVTQGGAIVVSQTRPNSVNFLTSEHRSQEIATPLTTSAQQAPVERQTGEVESGSLVSMIQQPCTNTYDDIDCPPNNFDASQEVVDEDHARL